MARAKLEEILGPATIVVRSGGKWTNPGTGEIQDKLHLHWRLRIPARGDDLPVLKRARDLAARLVGGDPSNKPVCHPIRWPGSWHRKNQPVLCSIDTASPDREIDLGTAIAALTAAAPADEPRPKANGKDYSGEGADWASQVHSIISGDSYHGALVPLAAKMLAAGMSDGAAVNLLRAIMENSTAPRDERWHARYADIPRDVSTAREKFGQAPNEQKIQEPPLLQWLDMSGWDTEPVPERKWAISPSSNSRRMLPMSPARTGWAQCRRRGRPSTSALRTTRMRSTSGSPRSPSTTASRSLIKGGLKVRGRSR
jgi:hypothetical protein